MADKYLNICHCTVLGISVTHDTQRAGILADSCHSAVLGTVVTPDTHRAGILADSYHSAVLGTAVTPDTHRAGILADSERPICTGLLKSHTLQICHLGNLNTSRGFLGQAAAVTSQRAHVAGSEAHNRKFGTGEIGGKAGTGFQRRVAA